MSPSEPILSEFLTKEELAAELRLDPRTSIVGILAFATADARRTSCCSSSDHAEIARKSNRPWDVRYDGCRPEARNAPNLAFAQVCSDRNNLAAFLWWIVMSIIDIAIEAAPDLTRGRDNRWRGRCPACGYAKPTLEVAVEQDRLVSCSACGEIAGIAAMMGRRERHCYRAE